MRRLIQLGSAAAVLAVPHVAFAYCLTTTCDDKVEACPKDDNKCTIPGLPLFWPDQCVTFGVQADGSPKRNIDFALAEQVATRAFQKWISADCGGGLNPSIGVSALGKIYCDDVAYYHNPPAPNANVIIFRDNGWPHEALDGGEDKQTLALTTVTFDPETGALLDADIEVNSFEIALTTGDDNISADLQTILTHEIGHFFGLAHSLAPDAIMNPLYDIETKSFRQLSDDDSRGMCELYPPGELEISSCKGQQPVHGFSRYCGAPSVLATGGCAVAGAAPTSPLDERGDPKPTNYSYLWGIAVAASALGFARRRS